MTTECDAAAEHGFAAVRVVRSEDLDDGSKGPLRDLLDEAYDGDFGAEDWTHALGGWHVLADSDGRLAGHAAIVARSIDCGGLRLRVGYVEAVATRRDLWRRGIGTALLRRAGRLIADRFELGLLSTGEHAFYSRLGWERWRGPTFVATPDGRVRTPDDDDGLMILRTAATPALDLDREIVADWRTGDVW